MIESGEGIVQQQLLPGQKLPLPIQINPSRVTPVFGTAEPTRGLPEVLRRMAYGYPDYDAERWLLLLTADRVASGAIVATEMLVPGQQPLVVRHFARQARAHPVGALVTAAVPLLLGAALWFRNRTSR